MKLGSDADAWELEDAEVRYRNAPDLYPIPSIEDRSNLKAGDEVELFFLFRGRDRHGQFIQSERLRVTISDASAEHYVGVLVSKPASSTLVQPRNSIRFGPCHVASIRSKHGQNSE